MQSTVAVTGIGLVSPLGQDLVTMTAALAKDRGCQRMTKSCMPGQRVAVADFTGFLQGRGLKYHGLGSLMLAHAGLQALHAAGVDPKTGDTSISLLVGSAFGNLSQGMQYVRRLACEGPDSVQPMDGVDTITNSAVDFCAIHCGTRGTVKMITAGACSSLDAIIEGARMVAGGRAQQVLVAGFETLCPESLAILEARGWLASAACPDDLQGRPYCRTSQGMIPGEGAAALLLENEQAALGRGGSILARVLGGDFVFSPSDQWTDLACSLTRAGCRALESAGISSSSINWVCGNANGVPANDRVELLALQHLFGNQQRSPAISALKGFWGDALGASGALAAAAAIECLAAGFIPSTPGLKEPWPEARGLDLVTGVARASAPTRLLMLGADADGFCSALVLGK
jgi:3-oxoacyl-(acyl-carrier-protein) synthase